MPKIFESTRIKDMDNRIHLTKNNNALKKKKNYSVRIEMVLSNEESVSTEENYVLGLSGTQHEPEFRICAAMSDYSCIIYNVDDTLTKITSLANNTSPIIGTKFSPTSKNILYVATSTGGTTACDLRAKGKVVAEFKDNSADGKLKPLASFDISSDDKLLAAGTEHIGGDAFILFWDVRYNNSKTANMKNNLLGGYWESHMDDVTSLAFHNEKHDCLASGSTDGLINIFDLTHTSEDSALTFSLNTESSVDRVGWLENGDIWCTTHTHELQLWHSDDAIPFRKHDRMSVASCLQNEDQDNCYLVRMHNRADGEPLLLTGLSTPKGENLHALAVDKDGLKMCLDFHGNKQLVRDSWYHSKSGCFITGGEAGLVNVWKQSEQISTNEGVDLDSLNKSNGKSSTRDKLHRSKPY